MDATKEMIAAAEMLADCFESSWNHRDGPAYGRAYWDDAELVDPTGSIWNGRHAIEAMHVDLWRGPARTTTVAAAVRRVMPLGTTFMLVDLEIDVDGFAPPPPGAAVNDAGTVRARLKHIAEKRGYEWRIVASQNTFVAARPDAR